MINLVSNANLIFICSSLLCVKYLASDDFIHVISVIRMEFRPAEDQTHQRTIWTKSGRIRSTRTRKIKCTTAKTYMDHHHSYSTVKTCGAIKKRGAEIRLPGRGESPRAPIRLYQRHSPYYRQSTLSMANQGETSACG